MSLLGVGGDSFNPSLLSAFGSSFHALCSVGSTLWPLPPSFPLSPRAGLSSSPVLPALPWLPRQWAPGQVPRALLTQSSSLCHPFPSSFPAFNPFLKPPYVFCTEQPGLLLHREGRLIQKQHALDRPAPQTNQGPTVPDPSSLMACTLDSLLQLPQSLQLRSARPLEI